MHTITATDVTSSDTISTKKVVLVTGGARRIGAAIVRACHQADMNVIIHYHHSQSEALALAAELNDSRANSAMTVCADLTNVGNFNKLIARVTKPMFNSNRISNTELNNPNKPNDPNGSKQPANPDNIFEPNSGRITEKFWGRLDGLINNASVFYSTPFIAMSPIQWQEFITTNAQAPLFLAQAACPFLQKQSGAIVNILDTHIERPLSHYSLYSFSKSLLASLTTILANECAPHVRVNGIAPGTMLWPEGEESITQKVKDSLINRTLLKRAGKADDIAQAVVYFLQANYVTGQILAVDGGRMINA